MKLLLYCTKAKPYLLNQNIYEFYDSKYITSNLKCHEKYDYILNGKIVAECDYEVEEIVKLDKCISYYCRKTTLLEEKSCLTSGQIYSYLKDKNGYAIHIKNLHIFDKPKELNEMYTFDKQYNLPHQVKKAPQNMMKVDYPYYSRYEDYILISIRPEWLCKILNREKTIEVRKKVLKEMLNNE